jgi:hypothetical protein
MAFRKSGVKTQNFQKRLSRKTNIVNFDICTKKPALCSQKKTLSNYNHVEAT